MQSASTGKRRVQHEFAGHAADRRTSGVKYVDGHSESAALQLAAPHRKHRIAEGKTGDEMSVPPEMLASITPGCTSR